MQKLLDEHAAERSPQAGRMALAGTIATVDDPEADSEPEVEGLAQVKLRPKAKRV